MADGLSDDQWQTFGRTLRAVHESGLSERLWDRLPRETFALPAAALVRHLLVSLNGPTVKGATATRYVLFLRARSDEIHNILARAEAIGTALQARAFPFVLCHTDIHTANILVGEDGRIYLVDWDEPRIAPKERDLFFVVGGRVARTILPREEDLFLDGYGRIDIDANALVYFRYERIVEDIGEFTRSVLHDPDLGEAMRTEEARLAMGLFAPGDILETVEVVDLRPSRRRSDAWP